MDPDFWRARWRKGEIGFHQAGYSWALTSYADRLALGPESRVLVPLCGKSKDLAFLAGRSGEVVGAELVDDAVRAFYAEHQLDPEMTAHGAKERYHAGGVTLWSGDFFALSIAELGRIDAVFDRAALIALPPPVRERYVERVRALAPGARVLLVTLEFDDETKPGPPFSVPSAEVERAFAGARIEQLEARQIIAESPKFSAAGCDSLLEIAWLIQL